MENTMRAAFGLVGLVVALAIVAVVAKKQLGSVNAIQVPQPAGTATGAVVPAVDPNATVKQQSQQIQQQYKQAVEGALQQARPMPDDK
jgi:hypothetical protein